MCKPAGSRPRYRGQPSGQVGYQWGSIHHLACTTISAHRPAQPSHINGPGIDTKCYLISSPATSNANITFFNLSFFTSKFKLTQIFDVDQFLMKSIFKRTLRDLKCSHLFTELNTLSDHLKDCDMIFSENVSFPYFCCYQLMDFLIGQ